MALGSIVIDLLLKTGAFNSDARLAERRMKEMERTAKRVGAAIGTAIAAGAAAATVAIKSQINAMDELSKSALRAHMPTEEFSQLAYAGSLADVEMGNLVSSMGRLARAQSDAQRGLATQADAFAKLGIAFEDSSGKLRSGMDVLKDFADVVQSRQGDPEVLAAGMQVFGRSFQSLIPLLSQGRAGLEAAADEADRLGYTLGTEAGRQAEEFNDNLTRLQTAVQGFWREVATGLLPQLVETTSSFQRIKTEGDLARNTVSLLTGVFDAGIWIIDQYNNAVDRTSIAIGVLARASAGMDEIRRNFGLPGFFREGSVKQGYEDIISAFEDGQRDLDALIERQQASRQGQGLIAIAGVDAEPTGVFSRTTAQRLSDEAAEATRREADARAKAQEAAARGARARAEAERELAEALRASEEADRAAQRALMDAEHRRIDWQNRIDDLTASLGGPVAMATLQFRRSIAEANAALATGVITIDEYQRYAEGLGRTLSNVVAEVDVTTGEMTVFADQAARNMQDAFANFLFDPFEDGVSGMAKAFGDALRRMAAEAAASEIFKLIGNWASNYTGAGSGWINAIGGTLSGKRATGGPVMAGGTYLVGEQGPELLRMGSNSGTVIPNNRISGMVPAAQGTVVEVHNHGGSPARTERGKMPDGRDLIRVFIGEAARDVAGGGAIAQAFESSYGVTRRGVALG